ncbi:unnamed protein product [Symbiodinium sp. CCMP2592]|nr:unnamed protein product [Symbiodinium sp. CCMP2592]
MALGLHLDMRLQRVADVGSYAALLTACRSGTAWQTSLVLLKEAYSVQLQPDSDTTCSSAVISALTRATQVSKALMARHLASETPNFNALIMSLRHVQASWVHAFHVLEDMKRRQISSDMGTLKAALSICGKHKPELVPEISRQLQIQPDILAVNMIVGSMEKCHSWQAALRELRLVGQMRLRADLTTYNTVISACSKASRWSWALHLVDVMASSALEPDEITSGSLITACSSQGRWLLALQLLHLHSLRHGRPNLIAAHSAITACEKAGRWMWSLHLFSDALSSRLTPDLSLLGAVLSSFEKGQQWARALQLLSQIIQEGFSPDIALITSAISACAKAHCWEMTLLLTYEYPGCGCSFPAAISAQDPRHPDPMSHDCHQECQGDGNEDEESLTAELGPSRLVGGLILRGNKCVLIRSLSGEWEGMRLPWGASNIEPGARAAVQIVSELCEIEEEEVTTLEIAPVTIAVPDMPILLHALYAANPPPAGSAADSDGEDPEDVYDWYTFPRAMSALAKDPYARAALATMAFALAAGTLGGLVPKKWGGIFGQEWVTPALQLLPGPGLELEAEAASDAAGSSGTAGAASRKRKMDDEEKQAMSQWNLAPNEATAGAALSSLAQRHSWQLAESILERLRCRHLQQCKSSLEPVAAMQRRCYERALKRPTLTSRPCEGALVTRYIAEDLVDLRDLPPQLARAAMRDAFGQALFAGSERHSTREIMRQAEQAFYETAVATVQGLVEQLGLKAEVSGCAYLDRDPGATSESCNKLQNDRKPHPAFDVPGEADLVGRICEILAFHPIEVNNLSSRFATVFNQVVRNSEHTPFSPEKRNDGSFKKWLLACGFEVGPLFDRNKSLVYLPSPRPKSSRGDISQPRRRFHCGVGGQGGAREGCDRLTGIASVEEQKASLSRRWEVKRPEDAQPQNQLSMLMAAACFLAAPTVSPEASPPKSQARNFPDTTLTSAEPEPERSESVQDDVSEQDSAHPGHDIEQDADIDTEPEEANPEESDCESQAAWVEVRSAIEELDEADFVLVGDTSTGWEEAQGSTVGSWTRLPPDLGCSKSEAVDFVTYNNNEILASDNTGALIDVSGSRDTPSRLSDRIVTISGQAEQKARACLGIVQKLRKLQDLLDSEIGFFVIIVPATAIPVIVGIKGATIAEVLEGTGVEISIGKENVMGMPDTPIGLEGTAEQVTTAVANIHKVVQDMADRGRLLPADFKYRPEKAAAQLAAGAGAHLPEVTLPPIDHNLFYGMDPTQNFRTKAKIVVDTGLAGSGIEIKKEDGVYRTPLLKNRIPEPEIQECAANSSNALAAAHWDGSLVCRLAVDIGGTFTDAVLEDGEEVTQRYPVKVLTTSQRPAKGFVDAALRAVKAGQRSPQQVRLVLHGTTLATNAVLERRGAKAAVITTKGFRDTLDIGRSGRYDRYKLNAKKAETLIPRSLCFEVSQRHAADGTELEALDEAELEALAPQLQALGVQSIAVCFLHSYMNTTHEERAVAVLRPLLPDVWFCTSSAVSPEIREYERFSTAAANAYVQPLMSRYLKEAQGLLLECGFGCPLLVMTSGGGLMDADTASLFPVRLIESGPAGGAVLAEQVAREAKAQEVLSLDMGGTTAKLCAISKGRAAVTRAFEVDRARLFMKHSGLPLQIPCVDLVEISGGGGSIASRDVVAMRVGPQSAGSDPGPACYNRGGDLPTVTDADLVLGYLTAGSLAGGELDLKLEAAEAALQSLAKDEPTERLAQFVFEAVEDSLATAARAHAAEHGLELHRHVLVAYGGASPLRAAKLAERLRIRTVLIPPDASVGSAIGFFSAPLAFEALESCAMKLSAFDHSKVNAIFRQLWHRTVSVVAAGAARWKPGRPPKELRRAYARYVGQGHEVAITLPNQDMQAQDAQVLRQEFEASYKLLGFLPLPGREVEICSFALEVVADADPLAWPRERLKEKRKEADASMLHELDAEAPTAKPSGSRAMYCSQQCKYRNVPTYFRNDLQVGERVPGPAIIVEAYTTTVVTESFDCFVLANKFLQLESRVDTLGVSHRLPEKTQRSGIELELAWTRLLSVLEEQAHFAVRGAFSPLFRESSAVTCAVFDANNRLLAHSQTSSPSLLGLLMQVLGDRRSELELGLKSESSWVELGQGCPSTIVAITPFAAQGFIASAAHLVGVAQDFATAVTTHEADALDGQLLEPMLAQEASVLLACNALGRKRLQNLFQEWETSLLQLGAYIVQVSQTAVLKNLSRVHQEDKLSCTREILIQNALASETVAQRVELSASVLLASDTLECRLTATQRAPPTGSVAAKGSSATSCRAFAQFAFLSMFGQGVPANHGSLSVFRVSIAAGCLLDMPRQQQHPDASTLAYFLPDLIYGCFRVAQCGEHICPPAESSASLCCLEWRQPGQSPGIHIEAGGTGAHMDQDGLSSTIFPSGFKTTPIEVMEQSGILFKRKMLIQDSGGAGCFRGGLGVRVEVSGPSSMSFRCTQAHAGDGPAGRDGGQSGAMVSSRTGSGTTENTYVIETAGGGGFGPSAKRPRTNLLHDVHNGYISCTAAASEYGLRAEDLPEEAAGKRDPHDSGWLIGKGGRTIREMQENSGAFLHVIREDEPTPLLKPGDRLIEVCGRLERKLEGIQVVLRTADSMPGNAPRETRIIVPEVLAVPPIMDQVAAAYSSCVVEREPGPSCDGEAMLLIAGPIISRIQAIQDFMSKTDRAHIEGIVVAKSIDGEIVGKDGRARREIREGLGYAPINPPPPREPNPWLLRDPQSRSEPAQQEADTGSARPYTGAAEPLRSNGDVRPSDPWQVEEVVDKRALARTAMANGEIHDDIKMHQSHGHRGGAFERPEPSVPERPYTDLQAAGAWEESNDCFLQPPDRRTEEGMNHDRLRKGFDIDEAVKAAVTSAVEAAPQVEALLQSSSSMGHLRGTLSVLLASDVLFSTLVPGGHMQDLAQKCQVHIDIISDASIPSSMRQVVLTGSLANNAAAAYWLQVGTARHLASSRSSQSSGRRAMKGLETTD